MQPVPLEGQDLSGMNFDINQMMAQHASLFNTGHVITPKNFELTTAYDGGCVPVTISSVTHFKEDGIAQLERSPS